MTALSLTGTARAEPVWINTGSTTNPRPDGGQYTELGLGGFSVPYKTFTAKGAGGGTVPRPDGGQYTALGLSGSPGVYQTFTPKAGTVGIVGHTALELLPQATITIGRRRTVLTDLVLGIRPMGATITVARTSNRTGRTTLTLSVMASALHYRRDGAEYSYQGGSTITFGTFGSVGIRRRRAMVGTNTISFIPGGTRVYTPAPVRNHHVLGSSRIRLTPQAAFDLGSSGVASSFSGTNAIEFGVFGRISVIRQTTFTQHGSLTLRLTPHGTVTKGTGPPVAYYVYGGTTLSLTPRATLGYNLGEVEQHAIVGHSAFSLTPQARITLRRAPTITPLGTVRRGRRRFIRLFNR